MQVAMTLATFFKLCLSYLTHITPIPVPESSHSALLHLLLDQMHVIVN